MQHVPGAPTPPKDQIAPLTSLRFFAAFFVVIYHLQGNVIPMGSMNQLALGVSFFFVLSGFILSTVYPDTSKISLPKFYVSRLARLWPVHALCFAVVVYLYDPGMLTNEFWQPKLLTNLLMLHAWIPQAGYVFSLNSVSWSISVELGFYLIFPVLAASKRLGTVFVIAGILVMIMIFQLEFNDATASSDDPWKFSAILLVAQSPFTRVFEFIVGMWAARIYREKRFFGFVKANANPLEVASIFLLLAYCIASRHIVANILAEGFQAFGNWFDVAGGVFCFAILIFVFAHSAGVLSKFLSHRILLFLGESSFTLYMVHQIIIKYAEIQGWTKLLSWPKTLLLICAAIAITTVVVHVLWERPMRWLIVNGYAALANRMSVIKRLMVSEGPHA
ncbi:acyltransferase [Pandoraea commovens]|uniref:Acyltransferase n=2 Tax=Burkholderiaceae TaxID=119060 RepID=A0A5E4SHE8_9BURK|nr:acyltransferase [Pandoraea commovens]VVD74192.1 acyltransferase [Pandoraea commovens]